MKYNKNFDKMLEDLRNRIEAVDLILTLLVLGKLKKKTFSKIIFVF